MKQEIKPTTAADIELLLADLFLWSEDVDGTDIIDHVDTFGDAGVMTKDKGVVLKTRDGREFQLTIVRSK